MPNTATSPGPITAEDLTEIISVAELASKTYRIVAETSLCRTGAVLRIDGDFRETVLDLVQAAGYTARLVSRNTLVVTAAIDRLALLDAQIAALTAERNRLVAADTTPFVPTLTPEDLAPKSAESVR